MLLEAKAFGALVLLADQYKRTQSLPWPLHKLPSLISSAWASLMRVSGFRRSAYSEISNTGAPASHNSLEMMEQVDAQVYPSFLPDLLPMNLPGLV